MDIVTAVLFFGFVQALRTIWNSKDTKARTWPIELRILLLAATVAAYSGLGISIYRVVADVPPVAEIKAITQHTPMAPLFEANGR